MVILGLGSNLGDRLKHLREAFAHIKKIPNLSVQQVSPIYISDALLPQDAENHWDIPYLNLALRCETTLNPYDLLHHLKRIESTLGRKPEKRWAPRLIDIDILAWDNFIQYDKLLHIPHEQLHERPFALWPLADVAPDWIYPLPGIFQGKTAAEMVSAFGSRFTGEAPFHTKQIAHRIDTPQLMGIINVTPDSFSDGGKYDSIETVIQQIETLALAGADIIDIGAEATNPKTTGITPETEWERLAPILHALPNFSIPPKISIDTRHADIAKKALDLGVNWINDVSGLEDPAMREVIAASDCDVVVMHHLGIPVDKKKILPPTADPVKTIFKFAEKKIAELVQHGISRERIIFDVGIGFGKTAEHCLALIKHIAAFQSLGVRLLVGHSRKLFLNLFTQQAFAERDIETTAISIFLNSQPVDYLRVHNVEQTARALKVIRALI